MITIKVSKVPGPVREVTINSGDSVSQALDHADIGDISGYKLKFNGSEVTSATTLTTDGNLVATQEVKGN
jgi:hypothetical protein